MIIVGQVVILGSLLILIYFEINMILELNLVKINAPYSTVGELLERKHYEVKDDAEALNSVVAFIGENTDTLGTIIPEKDFVQRLSMLKTITVDQYMSVKYLLMKSGVDIWGWVVAEAQQVESLPDDKQEFNVVDRLMPGTDTFSTCTKQQYNKEGYKVSDIYLKIYDSYEFFSKTNITKVDPFTNQLQAMRDIEGALGVTSPELMAQANQMLSYLGKNIYVIQ